MGQAGTAHGPRAVISRTVAFAVACLTALVVVDWWAVHTVRGRLLDARSLRGALLTGPTTTHALDQVLDVVSVTSLLAAVAVVLAIALVRLHGALGLAAVALLIGANTTTELLKHVVLSRPYLRLVEPAAATANSLPSGHVTVAFSVAVALVLVLPPALCGAAIAAGVAFTLAMSIATMTAAAPAHWTGTATSRCSTPIGCTGNASSTRSSTVSPRRCKATCCPSPPRRASSAPPGTCPAATRGRSAEIGMTCSRCRTAPSASPSAT